MKHPVRKTLAYSVLAALVAVALWFGSGAVAAWRNRRAPVELPAAATLAPDPVLRPGDAALAELEFSLPWGNAVEAAAVEPGENAVVSGPVRITSKWRWGRRVWRVGATLRPLASRGAQAGRLILTLARPAPGAEEGRCAVPIPPLRVAENAGDDGGKELRFAGPEELDSKRAAWRWLVPAAALAALVLLALWRLLRRRALRGLPPPPPWEVARAELAELRAELPKRAFRPERGVAALADILRKYLAARFDLPAATEPGSGFLDRAAMLTPNEAEFLRGFFAAADLVKFARFPADRAELESSLDRAAALVERTVPAPEPDADKTDRRTAS